MNQSVQIQSLFSNNSQSLILGHLGAISSLHILGPLHGVLPIGPNGTHGLGTLPTPPLLGKFQPSPPSDEETNAAILSYNYTLNHQGFASNISCIYDTQSPIRFSAAPNNTSLVNLRGFCHEIGLADVNGMFKPIGSTPDTDQTLMFWTCKSLPTEEQHPAYYIYLRGRGVYYEEDIGNISCTVSAIQLPIYPVTYQSSTGVFTTQEHITTSAPGNNFSDFIEHALYILGSAVGEAQTSGVNLVAESVKVLGLQAGYRLSDQKEQYLPLYETIIQGILANEVCTASNSSRPLLMVVPQVTYMRFLYSTAPANNFSSPPPVSCMRAMEGILSTEVTGWVARPVHVGFLMPMTILNLASLVIVWRSRAGAKRCCHEFDLIDPRSLVSAEANLDASDHSGWADGVLYRSREVRECQI
jgi:hypothetical protein